MKIIYVTDLLITKLSIHFGEDKAKSIVFGKNKKLKALKELDIKRGDTQIKQHPYVKYLGCVFKQELVRCHSGFCPPRKVSGRAISASVYCPTVI